MTGSPNINDHRYYFFFLTIRFLTQLSTDKWSDRQAFVVFLRDSILDYIVKCIQITVLFGVMVNALGFRYNSLYNEFCSHYNDENKHERKYLQGR